MTYPAGIDRGQVEQVDISTAVGAERERVREDPLLFGPTYPQPPAPILEQHGLTPQQQQQAATIAGMQFIRDPTRWDWADLADQDTVFRRASFLAKMLGDYPDLLEQATAADIEAASNLTTEAYLAHLFTGGEMRDLVTEAFRAIDDETARYESTVNALARVDSEQRMTLALTEPYGFDPETLDPQELDAIWGANRFMYERFGGRLEEEIKVATSGNRLIIYQEASGQRITLDLDEGTSIGAPVDVLYALAAAAEGRAHTIVSAPDVRADVNAPETLARMSGAVTGTIGKLLDAIGGSGSTVEAATAAWIQAGGTSPLIDDTVTPLDPEEERVAVWAEELAAQERHNLTTPEGMIIAAAIAGYSQNPTGGYLAAADGVTWLAAAAPAEVAEFTQLINDQVTADKYREMLPRDERTGFRRAVDTALNPVIRGLEWYGRTVDRFAVRTLDFLGDTGQFFEELVAGDEPGFTNPITAVDFAYDPTEAQRLSEYYGLEDSTWGFYVDLAGGLGFDPAVWFTAGAGASRRFYQSLIRDPAKVGTVMRLPAVRKAASEIARATAADDLRPLATFSSGMSFDDIVRIADSGGDLDTILTRVTESLPAAGKGGTYLVDLAGNTVHRHTASAVMKWARQAAGTGEQAGRARTVLARNLGGFSRDHVRSVAPGVAGTDFLDDLMVIQAAADMPVAEFNRWFREAIDVHKTFTAPRDAARTAALADLVEAQKTVRAASEALPADVAQWVKRYAPDLPGTPASRFTELQRSLRSAETRVTEIDTELALAETVGAGDDVIRRLTLEREAVTSESWARWEAVTGDIDDLRGRFAFTQKEARKTGKPLADQETADDLAALVAERTELGSRPMLRGFTAEDEAWRGVLGSWQEYLDARRASAAAAERASAAIAGVGQRGASTRKAWGELHQRFEDWVGDEILHLPRDPKTDRLDWSKVVGPSAREGRKGLVESGGRGRLSPMADSPAEIAAINESGLMESGSYAYFHRQASPLQIAAYLAAGDSAWWQKWVVTSVRGARTGPTRRAETVGRFLQHTFATIVLNPKRAVRASIDEMVRLGQTGGRLLPGRRTVGINPATGKATKAVQPGVLAGTVTQFGPAGLSGISERARWAAREAAQSSPFRGLGEEWTLVGQKSSGTVARDRAAHTASATRLYQGQLMDNPALAAWAQDLLATSEATGLPVMEVLGTPVWTDTTRLANWYRTGGAGEVTDLVFDVTKGTIRESRLADHVTAGRNMFLTLAGRSAAADPAVWIDDLIRRVAGQKKLAKITGPDRVMLRGFGPLPTDQVGAAGRGLLDTGFEVLYGRPGRNRHGIINIDLYAQNIDNLMEAHRQAGTLLTAETLTERLGWDATRAVQFMETSGDEAAALAHEWGMVTPRYLDLHADRTARLKAGHMMYQPGATSMLGAKYQRAVEPFGPARFDYLSLWQKELVKPTLVGMFGKYAQIPNFPKTAAKLFRPSLRGSEVGALPLNLRLLDRIGVLSGGILNHTGDETAIESAEGLGVLSTGDVINELLFFPNVTDNPTTGYLIEYGPGLGPMWGSTIRLLPDPEEVDDDSTWLFRAAAATRDVFETLQPAIEYSADTARTFGPGLLWSMLDSLLPNTPGNPRDLIQTGIETGLRALGADVRWSEPYGLGFVYDAEMSTEFEERWKPGVAGPGGHLPDLISEVSDRAYTLAFTPDAMKSFLKAVPMGVAAISRDGDARTDQYGVIAEYAPTLTAAGLLGEYDTKDLERLWADYQAGTLTVDGEEDLRDLALNTLFRLRDVAPTVTLTRTSGERAGEPFDVTFPLQQLLVAQNPGLSLLMVSRYETGLTEAGLPVKPEWVTAGGRLDLSAADDPQQVLIDGLSANPPWFVKRTETDRTTEADWRVGSSRQDLLRYAWMWLTGRPRFDASATAGETGSKELKTRVIDLASADPTVREMLRVNGAFGGELPATVTGQQLADELVALSPMNSVTNPWMRDTTNEAELRRDDWVAAALDDLDRLNTEAEAAGYQHPSEWPEPYLEAVRETGRGIVARVDWFTEHDWINMFGRDYGPLDWETPDPPTLYGPRATEVESVLRVDPADIQVVDGDTIHVLMADGTELPVRFIGINAPDQPMAGAGEATDDLIRLLRQEGREVSLVIWESDRYGTEAGRDTVTGGPRVKAWLYVDGFPVFHPESFTFSNPTGASTGTAYRPLPRPPVEGAL